MGELPTHQPDDVTVLDMEASIEHLTRGTVRNVDVLLVVTEPYYRSLETMGRTAPHAPPPPRHASEVGNVAGISQEKWVGLIAAQTGPPTITGPFEKVHVFWLAGMSCDGCSIAVLGATAPKLEDLLTGTLPGLPV